jgi:hypothetical protein
VRTVTSANARRARPVVSPAIPAQDEQCPEYSHDGRSRTSTNDEDGEARLTHASRRFTSPFRVFGGR